jgi:gluconolactonase
MDPRLTLVASGLEFPEGGPIWLDDGSVLLVEIKKGTLTKVSIADGTKTTVATTGGGPNSSAMGPDGCVYITQNGGFEWTEINSAKGTLLIPGDQPADYTTGSIQKVDCKTGKVTTLYTTGVAADGSTVMLRGPNDLVFDKSGGFYFTDHGKNRTRDKDRVGVFYALADGSLCKEIVFPMEDPNGCALSPDGKWLYVAETPTGRLYKFAIDSPGTLSITGVGSSGTPRGECIYSSPGRHMFDSMAGKTRCSVYEVQPCV